MSLSTADIYRNFNSISLAKTNQQAKMLSRIDNKYIINSAQFAELLSVINREYSIMEIDAKREFAYRSCYYDDDFCCYREHHQGRRQRLKVRTREYLDGGGMKYFELKLKGTRGLTVKHRNETDRLVKSRVDGQELDMLRDIYRNCYRKEMSLELAPSLMIDYRRSTLVAHKGGERVTLDSRLSFAEPRPDAVPVLLGRDFIIVETKSEDGKGIADRALARLGIRQTPRCSKYCIGINLIGSVERNNNFQRVIQIAQKNIVHPTGTRLEDCQISGQYDSIQAGCSN